MRKPVGTAFPFAAARLHASQILLTLPAMSTHEAVQTILQQLPPDVSLHEVAREIEFIAGVREGFAQLDRGEGIPIEEVEKMIPKWAGK